MACAKASEMSCLEQGVQRTIVTAPSRVVSWTHRAALPIVESPGTRRVFGESEAMKVGSHPSDSDHVVRRAWRARASDAREEALSNGVVLTLADFDCHIAMVLSGAAEHVEIEQKVTRLKSGHLRASAGAHGSKYGG